VTLQVNGDYTQAAGTTLRVAAAANNVNSELSVQGTATLNGTLDLVLVNGYVPQKGDALTVLGYAGRNGVFAAMPPGWTPAWNATDLTITW
jgi:hypothetical protein